MWNILLVIEEVVKALTRSVLTTKSFKLQTELKIQITLHGVLMYIMEDPLGVSFSDYGPVEDAFCIKSKAGIATSDNVLMMTLTCKKFNEVLNGLT